MKKYFYFVTFSLVLYDLEKRNENQLQILEKSKKF